MTQRSAYRFSLLSFCPLSSFWSKLTPSSLFGEGKNRCIRAHMDALRQHNCCEPIINTGLPGPEEHPLNQQLCTEQINDVYTGIN